MIGSGHRFGDRCWLGAALGSHVFVGRAGSMGGAKHESYGDWTDIVPWKFDRRAGVGRDKTLKGRAQWKGD